MNSKDKAFQLMKRTAILTSLTFLIGTGSSILGQTAKADDQPAAQSTAATPDVTRSESPTSTPTENPASEAKTINQKHKQVNEQTAKAINNVPGVQVSAKQLEVPAEEKPIKGFHPIKRAIQPVVQLEKNSTQLQQQIMKLEGPIAGLQKPMNDLHGEIGGVKNSIDDVHTKLGAVDSGVRDTGSKIADVESEIKQVRTDIIGVRKDISGIQPLIRDLQKPLGNVAAPLGEVKTELQKVQALIATVLLAIVVSTIGIAIGTPIAAVLIYKNRGKLFPKMSEREFPVVPATAKEQQPVSTRQ